MQLVILVSAVVSVASCARILAVLPLSGKSHFIFHSSVLKTLSVRGHQVVVYGPHPPAETTPNFTHFEVHTLFEDIVKSWKYEDFVNLMGDFSYFGQGATGFWPIMDEICNEAFKHENMQRLLHSDEKFDLVMTTASFGQESMNLFGHKFGAPTITLQGFAYSSILNHPTGNVLSVATIPDKMSFLFSNEMTLMERFRNLVSVSLSLFKYYTVHLPKQDAIVKQYYKVPNTPTVEEMVRNVSLTFINANPAVEYAISYTPNIIPIAGISVVTESKPLPQDIKKFMDEATHGVIYFSLGSNLPMHTFPKEFTQVFVNVFKKLPQKILWKNEAETVPGLPENVKLAKWVPQIGVIGHPNCKLFITHGGLFSQQEAIHAGVPTIGIPFFADQPYNIKFNEQQGIGVGLNLKSLSEDKVFSAIQTVLKNPMYRENAQQLSRVFRDRPLSAADTVVFWTEYVLRHAGAHHLRPASTQLSWYQLCLLDVLAVILLSTVAVMTVIYLALKKILSCCGIRSKEQTNVSTSKKHKQL